MTTLQYYSMLHPQTVPVQPKVKRTVEQVSQGKPILSDAVLVTLAEYDPTTKNAITAHHLKDYRRRIFNLKLLPEIDLLFDHVLEGSEYWNGLLNAKSNFS